MTAYRAHSVTREDRPDGSIRLRSDLPLGRVVRCTGEWLHRWAGATPGAVFLAERSGPGWRALGYGETLERVRAVASALLARGLGPETPIIVLSGNGVDHGLLALAAQYVGIPTVPVAEQYSLIEAAHPRLARAVAMTRPAMAYVADAERFASALGLEALAGVEVVSSRPGGPGVTGFDALEAGGGPEPDAAHAAVGPDTVAKILLTSGSTSAPKGVLTTQGMMCANQAQIAAVLPFLAERPPRIVDWLPWNHVFGGSHNFNMMLAHGGALYIDDGKPAQGLFGRRVENLSLVTGTAAFEVPLGFTLLLAAMERDKGLRNGVFAELDLIFCAGASLPQVVWEGLERMAREATGRVPLMTSGWGLTETAPACLMQHEPGDRPGAVGVPLPGVEVKLVPDPERRCEVRVTGPNVTPGYVGAPETTAAAFDGEGFFVTGDAMVFVDPDDADRGLRFEGRISEDFKLQTGTWVRSAALRLDMLAALAPLAQDVVITGADRHEVGVLVVPNLEHVAGLAPRERGGVLVSDALRAELAARLASRADGAASSKRVARALVLAEPPSMAEGEITAKGNLNNARLLSRRKALVERLYDDADPDPVKLRGPQ